MHRPISLEFLPKVIGVPYEEMDCWDIVKYFYAHAFDIDLSAYDIVPQDLKTNAPQIEKKKRFFDKIEEPRTGDIILFTVLGHNAHVGIYLDSSTFLHTKKSVGCAIERFEYWKKRIEGIYRWPELK